MRRFLRCPFPGWIASWSATPEQSLLGEWKAETFGNLDNWIIPGKKVPA